MKNSVKLFLIFFCFLCMTCNMINVYAQEQVSTSDETTQPTTSTTTANNAQTIEVILDRLQDLPLCLIEKDDRLSYLFPDGVPTSQNEMVKYLTTIEVLTWTGTEDKTIELTVHKKLADTYKRIFNELYLMKFPINLASCYCFRTMNNGSGTDALSHHSYGVALDINWDVNPHIYYGTPDESSQYYINADVVNVFKSHGFYWGGDWNDPWTDWMHFTYTDH